MKILITTLTLLSMNFYCIAAKPAQDNAKSELITDVQNKLILNYFPQDGSFKDSAVKIKNKMTDKMLKNYSLNDLKELKNISENKTFMSINNKFQDQDIKIEDILLKSSEAELKKIDSKKKATVTSIKNTLSLDKYSKQATQILEKKLIEKIPEGIPDIAINTVKESLKEKAQDGLVATVYEQLGKIDATELSTYQQQIKKKSFLKYYNDLMELTYNELK